ncbi:MAG: ABC transporter permease [Alphaproteobacteria bacterium]
MGALNRKLLRDLWRLRGQVLATALVIGCGVALFVMSQGVIDSLEETRTAYYERYRFADVFASAKRAPERLVRRIARIPGVRAVETRIVEDVTMDVRRVEEPVVGRLVSIPERGRPALNDLVIRQGRSVRRERPDEVVVSESFAESHGFVPGDHLFATINGHKRRLEIVGVGLSPEYVYTIAPGALMPDDRRFGIIWMGREALEAAFDFDGAFNDVSLALRRDTSRDEVIERLDDLLEPYGGIGAFERRDQTSEWFVNGEIEQLAIIASVLPVIFLAVAAFLLNMVLSRLIATERDQIGLLKGFGYGNGAVAWHYLKLALAVTVLGIALGFIVGAWLGRELTSQYAEFYRFPFLYYRPSPGAFATAALSGLGAAMAGALAAVRRAVALPPAEAMVPAPPPLYRRHRRVGFAGIFDQPTMMVLRHVGRWPVRSGFTTLGIAMAVAVLVMSLHWLDAIDHMIDVQYFDTQRHDVAVSLVEARSDRTHHEFSRLPGVLSVEPYRALPVRLRHGNRERRASIFGVVAEADLNRVLDVSGRQVRVPDEGLVLTKTLARLLGVGRGELLTVEVMEGRRPVRRLPVVDIFETYLGTPVYMSKAALNRLMLEGPAISGAFLQTDARDEAALYRALKDMPAVSAVTLRTAAVETFRDTLAETVNFIITFYVAFASLLAFGVVYNSTRISLSERGRELASLRVLGFRRGEVSYILLGELALLGAIALPLGCLIGYGLSLYMTRFFDNEVYRVPVIIEDSTYGIAVAIVTVATMLSGLLVRRRLDRLDLVQVLKTRE